MLNLSAIAQAINQAAGSSQSTSLSNSLSQATQAAVNYVSTISPSKLFNVTMPAGTMYQVPPSAGGKGPQNGAQLPPIGPKIPNSPVNSLTRDALKAGVKLAMKAIEEQNSPEEVDKRRKEEAEKKAAEAEAEAKKKIAEKEQHQRELDRRKFVNSDNPISQSQERVVAQRGEHNPDRLVNEPSHPQKDTGSNYMELRDMANSLGSNNWWNRQGIQAQRPGVLDPVDAQAVEHMEAKSENSFASQKSNLTSGSSVTESQDKAQEEADRRRKMRGSLV